MEEPQGTATAPLPTFSLVRRDLDGPGMSREGQQNTPLRNLSKQQQVVAGVAAAAVPFLAPVPHAPDVLKRRVNLIMIPFRGTISLSWAWL